MIVLPDKFIGATWYKFEDQAWPLGTVGQTVQFSGTDVLIDSFGFASGDSIFQIPPGQAGIYILSASVKFRIDNGSWSAETWIDVNRVNRGTVNPWDVHVRVKDSHGRPLSHNGLFNVCTPPTPLRVGDFAKLGVRMGTAAAEMKIQGDPYGSTHFSIIRIA